MTILKRVLLIAFILTAIAGAIMVLLLGFVLYFNPWYRESIYDIEIAKNRPLEIRISEWSPILEDLQNNQDPNTTLDITNSLVFTYMDEYQRTKVDSIRLKVARWLCEQNNTYVENLPQKKEYLEKLRFTKSCLNELNKIDPSSQGARKD